MTSPINSTKAAELIESTTGRTCSRQNLEKLCERGALQDSPCVLQRKPWRIDADLVVSEYLSKVAPQQAEAKQPRAKRERAAQPDDKPPAQLPERRPDDLPDYTISRARSEHEKANLLELERRTKEGELVYRADFITAQNAVAAQIMNRAETLPRQIKQAIPHLGVDEVDRIERLVKEMLEAVASWSYEEVEADE